MYTLDFHTHAFPDAVAPTAVTKLIESCKSVGLRARHDGTITGLEAAMDTAGIDAAVVSSIATKPSQNLSILEWCRALKEREEHRNGGPRFFSFPSVHPAARDLEEAVDRIAGLGFKGIKLHPYYQDTPLDSPNALHLARCAAKRNLVLLCHCGYDAAFAPDPFCTPLQVRNLVDKVDGLKFVAAHLGGWNDWKACREYLVGQPVWLDTSFALGLLPHEVALDILSSHPVDRLLFGSDSPWDDQAEAFANLAAFEPDFDHAWLEAVASGNALQLLG